MKDSDYDLEFYEPTTNEDLIRDTFSPKRQSHLNDLYGKDSSTEEPVYELTTEDDILRDTFSSKRQAQLKKDLS